MNQTSQTNVTKKTTTEQFHVVRRITETELLEILLREKGSNFEGMDCKVEVKMNKRDNPFYGNVWKFYSVNTISGADYENSVNRQREREGKETDFTAMPRVWGNRVGNTPVIEHKEEHYFEIYVKTLTTDVIYKDKDGNLVSKDDIAPFLPKKYESSQGIDKEIVVRTYKLSSILSIRMNKVYYQIVR